MARPTRDDAVLMLELADWHSASGVPEAGNWIQSKEYIKDFDRFEKRYPEGSKGRLHVLRYLGFHETLGTLWKNKLLSEELIFDWLWISGAWDNVREVALGMRKKAGVDAIWENFEAMAERQAYLIGRPRARAASATKARKRTTASSKARKRAAPASKARKRTAPAARKAASRSASARRR